MTMMNSTRRGMKELPSSSPINPARVSKCCAGISALRTCAPEPVNSGSPLPTRLHRPNIPGSAPAPHAWNTSLSTSLPDERFPGKPDAGLIRPVNMSSPDAYAGAGPVAEGEQGCGGIRTGRRYHGGAEVYLSR